MGIVKFDIELDNPERIYSNGSVINGKILLELDSPKSVKGIKLNVYGSGKISWEETFSIKLKDYYQAECVKEVYIDEDNFIFGSEGVTKVIPPGQHVFPFRYKLPETIPPHYEDEFGKILYLFTATIHRVWYLWNYKFAVEFGVEVPLDLNLESKAAEPASHNVSKFFIGCSKPTEMTVRLPVRGYIAGQTIPITVDINNGAGVKIKGVYFTLIKWNEYRGKWKKRAEEDVITDYETSIENANELIRIQHSLEIPELKPSRLKYSKLIDLEYFLRVEVRVGGLHKNFEVDVPIIIGTLPLLSSTVDKYQRSINAVSDPNKNET